MRPAPLVDDGRLFRACLGSFTPVLLLAALTARAWALPTPPPDLGGALRYKDVEFWTPVDLAAPPPPIVHPDAADAPQPPRPRAAGSDTPDAPSARSGLELAHELFAPIGTDGAGLDADRRTEDEALARAIGTVQPDVHVRGDALPTFDRPQGPAGPVAIGIQDLGSPGSVALEDATVATHARVPRAEGRPEETAADEEVGDLAAVVRAHRDRIETCVARALAADPHLSGRVSAAWNVTGGRVGDVTVDSSVGSPELEACVARAVRGFRFPAGSNGDVDRYTWLVSGR